MGARAGYSIVRYEEELGRCALSDSFPVRNNATYDDATLILVPVLGSNWIGHVIVGQSYLGVMNRYCLAQGA